MISSGARTSVEFDERGDLLVRVPRARLLHDDPRRIVQAIETALARSGPAETETAWETDALLDLVGRFEAEVTDGSLRHDRDLYERLP